jgi:multidrug/hemolysin transport system permease protein
MVQDKISGARTDMLITPVKRSALAFSYYISTTISTLIICLLALVASLIYVGIIGWYLTFVDVLLLLLDVVILVTFGTALSSVINYFLSSQGQISAVGSIVSSCYGFLCGAYMPLASFSEGLRNVIMFLPGTYGTSLVRNHSLTSVLSKLEGEGIPAQAIEGLKDSIDCNLYFFGDKVETWVAYAVIIGTIVLLLTGYVLINLLNKKKNK